MQSGAATTSDTTDEAPAAIALIGPGCTLERATARFRERYGSDEECLTAHQRKIERIISGKIDHVAVMLDGDVADVAAVVASDAQRYALISVPPAAGEPSGDSPNPLLDKPIDDSTAVVWLKDLDGRYIRVNGRYLEELGAEAEQVCGKTDAELSPSITIEGMRQGGSPHEPLEFEYTVGGYQERPSYSVVRFALRDSGENPIAVCGVAAPLSRAWMARSECDRLMRIERWSRLDVAELREEVLDEWGLAPLSDTLVAAKGNDEDGDNEGEQFAAIAAELDTALATSARLDRELAEERRQVMALREASILSARRAHELLGTVTAERTRAAELEQAASRTEARVAELEGVLAAERARTERIEARSTEAAESQRQAVETLELELASLKEELARARSAAGEAPAPEELKRARAEADTARREAREAQKALAELRAAGEQTESEKGRALNAERERAQALESELATAREALATVREELAQTEQAGQAELARAEQVAHDEIARAQQALGEEVARAQQAVRGELEREQAAALAAVRQDLDRARSEAAESAAALANERHRVQTVEGELTAVRAELERVQGVLAESVNRREAEARLSEVQAALEAERRTVGSLRSELDAARHAATAGDQAAEVALAGVRAELEGTRAELEGKRAELERAWAETAEAAATLAAERQAVQELRAELSQAEQTGASDEAAQAAVAGVRAELERAQATAAEAQTALAAERERVAKLEADLARRAETPAPAAPAPAPPAPQADGDGPSWNPSVQRALAAALSGVGEWRMALQAAVRALSAEGGWDAAIVFCPDDRRRLLECAAIATRAPLTDTTFETQAWQHRPEVSRREIGAAWDAEQACAVTDLGAAEDRLLKAAAKLGMASAALVPVRDGNETIAMIGLLSGAVSAPTPDVLIWLESVGLQIGAIGHLLSAAGAPRWRLGRL